MRNAFAAAVTELAETNPDLILLAGDIGNRLFDPFKEQHPDRFYNCGVAEAGMTGIAAGLASTGLQPITYTITPFNTLRCLEQIRLDICYPNLPVIIVGTGSGLSYAGLGATHHSMEDIAALRLMPNMNVVAPADAVEVKLAIKSALEIRQPTYIRIGKKGEPKIHDAEPEFSIGKSILMREGNDVAVLGVGTMLGEAIALAETLGKHGVSAKTISLHTIKPLDDELLSGLYKDFERIIVLEEHALTAGAGSAILEWGNLNEADTRKVMRFGGPDKFLTGIGNQVEARAALGLEAVQIAKTVLAAMNQ